MSEDMAAARAPDVIGPPHGDECDLCRWEPAEHRVRTWSSTAGGQPLVCWIFDLCGTCLAAEQKHAAMTVDESMAFDEAHVDRRREDEP